MTISICSTPNAPPGLIPVTTAKCAATRLSRVLDALINAAEEPAPRRVIRRSASVVDDVALNQLMTLAANDKAADEVRAMALLKLTELRAWATRQATTATDPQQRAHLLYAAAQIRKFEQEPAQVLKPTPTLDAPPGAPIGSTEWNGVNFQCAME